MLNPMHRENFINTSASHVVPYYHSIDFIALAVFHADKEFGDMA